MIFFFLIYLICFLWLQILCAGNNALILGRVCRFYTFSFVYYILFFVALITVRRDMNPSLLLLAMNKIVGQTELSSLVRQLIWKKEKPWIQRICAESVCTTGFFSFGKVTSLERKSLNSNPEECYSENLWHKAAPFFCYQVIKKVWLVLHKPY